MFYSWLALIASTMEGRMFHSVAASELYSEQSCPPAVDCVLFNCKNLKWKGCLVRTLLPRGSIRVGWGPVRSEGEAPRDPGLAEP